MPGLFQTEAYARAVFESGGLLEPEDVERRLDERLESQRILYEERPPYMVAEGSGRVMELTGARWRKSSRSAQTNDCVEVATNLVGAAGVRDSKDPAGPVLAFEPYSWRVFVAAPPR